MAISPVWPPASVPWATMRSAPAAAWRRACSTDAGERGDRDAGARARARGSGPAADRAPTRRGRAGARSTRRAAAPCSSGRRACRRRPRPSVDVVGRGRDVVAARAGRRGTPGARRGSSAPSASRSSPPSSAPTNFSGTSRSTPYGLPLTSSSIQSRSMSSCSGLCATAPSTPHPPAFVTAATTSRQWLKAKIGRSMPTSSVALVRMRRVCPGSPGPAGRPVSTALAGGRLRA